MAYIHRYNSVFIYLSITLPFHLLGAVFTVKCFMCSDGGGGVGIGVGGGGRGGKRGRRPICGRAGVQSVWGDTPWYCYKYKITNNNLNIMFQFK